MRSRINHVKSATKPVEPNGAVLHKRARFRASMRSYGPDQRKPSRRSAMATALEAVPLQLTWLALASSKLVLTGLRVRAR